MKKVLDKIYKQLYDETDYNHNYSDIYEIHKYWSRKPWYLVEKYIEKHTKENDLILDPFMGSGCTGIEAAINNRDFVGYDLNPISIKISKGTFEIVPDISKLKEDFQLIKNLCYEEIMSEYKTSFECPTCNSKLYIKHHCIGPKTNNKNLAYLYCPSCSSKKTILKEEIEILSNDSDYEKKLKKLWVPNKKFPNKFYKDRFSYKGVSTVADMYTKKNLFCLCKLYDTIKKSKLNYPDLIDLIFTNTVLHASKLKGENVRPLSVNNYWIPDDYIEENVWFRFEDRFNNMLKSKTAFNAKIKEKNLNKLGKCDFRLESCLKMNYSNKFDYIFTDPPYGEAIQYSELSFIYNAWLGEEYDIKDEVIINPCQNKNENKFLSLIDISLEKIYKALKKEKYFTLCFQNKDFIIWKNIIEKCKELGFKLEDISIYDTYGNPYNKYWSKFSPKSDIYVTFKKTDKPLKSRFFKENINLEQLIYEVADYTLDVKDNNKIYDLTVAYIIWSLFYNEGTMNITDFNLKQFIKYIESHQLRREQLTLDI